MPSALRSLNLTQHNQAGIIGSEKTPLPQKTHAPSLRPFFIELQEFVLTEQNIETAIAAYEKYHDVGSLYNEPEEDLGRYIRGTYHLLSQLIIEGYDFKPDSLDDPAILRKFPNFIPTRIPALWQTLACQGSRCTNTLCPDIQAVINKAVGIRRPATASAPEYRRCDSKAQASPDGLSKPL